MRDPCQKLQGAYFCEGPKRKAKNQIVHFFKIQLLFWAEIYCPVKTDVSIQEVVGNIDAVKYTAATQQDKNSNLLWENSSSSPPRKLFDQHTLRVSNK